MLIVFEGLDGAGKTTLAKLLADHLKVAYVHWPINQDLIHQMYHPDYWDYGYAAEMLYYSPTLLKGDVVCDRYYYSHFAYGGRYQAILEGRLPQPDFAFLMGAGPEVSFGRCQARGSDTHIDIKKRAKIWERYQTSQWSAIIPEHLSPSEALEYVQTYLQIKSTDFRFSELPRGHRNRMDD